MLNILIVNWTGVYGGVEKHLMMLAHELDPTQYRLIFAQPAGSFSAVLTEAGYRWYDVETPPRLDLNCIRRLAHIMHTEQIDIVHAQQSRTLYFSWLAAKLAGVKSIIQTEHNVSIDWYRRAQVTWRVRTLSRVLHYLFARFLICHIIAISSGVARYYTEVLNIPSNKVTVVHYAHPLLESASQPHIGNPQRPIVGTVALPRAQKGLDHLINAAALVWQKYPHVQFRLIGAATTHDPLAAQVKRLGLEDTVQITGFVENATAIMSQFDVFVMPSIWEPFGLVLLEAMANGLPVVASRIDGVPDVVLHGETGLLVPPADPVALAEAIIYLLDRPELARAFGEEGRKRCATEFTVRKMVDGISAVYEACAPQRGLC